MTRQGRSKKLPHPAVVSAVKNNIPKGTVRSQNPRMCGCQEKHELTAIKNHDRANRIHPADLDRRRISPSSCGDSSMWPPSPALSQKERGADSREATLERVHFEFAFEMPKNAGRSHKSTGKHKVSALSYVY
jgi:hypothetical protein